LIETICSPSTVLILFLQKDLAVFSHLIETICSPSTIFSMRIKEFNCLRTDEGFSSICALFCKSLPSLITRFSLQMVLELQFLRKIYCPQINPIRGGLIIRTCLFCSMVWIQRETSSLSNSCARSTIDPGMSSPTMVQKKMGMIRKWVFLDFWSLGIFGEQIPCASQNSLLVQFSFLFFELSQLPIIRYLLLVYHINSWSIVHM